jgi:hypothetical protein
MVKTLRLEQSLHQGDRRPSGDAGQPLNTASGRDISRALSRFHGLVGVASATTALVVRVLRNPPAGPHDASLAARKRHSVSRRFATTAIAGAVGGS